MNLNEPINNAKKLNVIAIVDKTWLGEAVVLHSVQLARAFKASLTVFTNFGFSIECKPDNTSKDNLDYITKNCTGIDVKIVNDYIFPETLFSFAKKSNTAMIVAGTVHDNKNVGIPPKKIIRFIKDSRFPVMAVTKKPENDDCYKEILLPLDMERQNKEKALWAGYFSRFHDSVVHILVPDYKDEGLAKLVNDNINFVKKLYENLEINYDLMKYKSSSYFDESALEHAKKSNIGASVIMMTKYYTLADVITGPRERKIIGKSDIPILCINQRDDLYVLCT